MRLLSLFLLLQLLVLPAYALESGVERAEFSTSRLIVGEKHVTGEGAAAVTTVDAGVELTFTEGWKTYWRSPGDAGFPLLAEPAEDAANLQKIDLHWPYPRRFVEEWGLEVFGFKHRVLVPMTLTLADGGKDTQAHIRISYAVCSDICINEQQELNLLIPADYKADASHNALLEKAKADVPAANGGHGMTINQAVIAEEGEAKGRLDVTATRDSGKFTKPELFVESKAAGLRFPQAEAEPSADGKSVVLHVPYEIALPAKTLGGQEVVLTLVSGGKAIEATMTIAKPDTTAPQAAATPANDGGATAGHDPSGGTSAAPETTSATLLPMLVLALLGGLVLNIMPCVLPVLSIKLLGAVKHGGRNSREVRQSFLASAAGILTFFLALAAMTITAREAGQAVGWGFHFQSPQFLTFLAVLVLLFAANLMGWFEIRLPESLNTHIYDVTGSGALKHRHHLLGDFIMGLFAALMATPCSAPFLGTAVGFALSRGVEEILAIFLMLGVGLALPYFAAALVPSLATRLPRPGQWMLRVKQVMGALMLLAGIWLLWVIAGQTTTAIALGVLLLSALLGAVMHGGGRWRFLRRSGSVAVICAALLAALALLPNLNLTPQQEQPQPADEDALWQPFDRAAIASHVADGKVVFVDVTADWCLTCKFNKLRVMGRDDVQTALAEDNVVAMQADMTRPMPDIQAYLKDNGRYGIPFNIVYGPAAPQGIALSEVLSVDEVMQALAAAQKS